MRALSREEIRPDAPWDRATRWRELRGAAVSGVLSLVTTVSYSTAAGAALGDLSPEHLASAVLSGMVGASIGAVAAAAITSAPAQLFSPRASVAVVIAAAAASFHAHGAPPAQVLALLTACVLLSALLLLAFAVLRLGRLIHLIPQSVASGLVIALGVKLAWSQLPWLMPADHATRPASWAIAVATLASIMWFRRRYGAAIGPLAGVAAGLLLSAGMEAVLAGTLPHLPPVDIGAGPLLSLSRAAVTLSAGVPQWPGVLGFAAVIALLNGIETLTSAAQLRSFGLRRFDPDRALAACGCASLVSLLAGGLPVGGSTLVSMAHVRAGGRSRAGALASAALVGAAAFAVGPLISKVPLVLVSALILFVAAELSGPPLLQALHQWRAGGRQRDEAVVACLVCAVLLAADVLTAVAAGVALASVLALVKMHASLVRREYDAADMARLIRPPWLGDAETARGIHIIELGQPLFFATVEQALGAIDRVGHAKPAVVLDLGRSGSIDATAAGALARCAAEMARGGRHLVLVGGPQLAEFEEQLHPCVCFERIRDALDHCMQDQEDERLLSHMSAWSGRAASAGRRRER